jgi:hypothetical protein
MENLFLIFIALPLLVGGGVLIGAWLLTRLMPGDGKVDSATVAAAKAAVPARGPEYVELTANRKKAYRVGYLMLLVLAVLTVAEIAVSLGLNSVALLFIVNILEAAAILVVFMHIKSVWASKETH